MQVVQQYNGDFSQLSESYLNVAVRGHAAKTLRRHDQACRSHKLETTFSDTADEQLNPEAVLLKREANAQLVQALENLPTDLQKIVFLRIFAELTFREIAAQLELSERRAQLAFERALGTLRSLMEVQDAR